jgi:glycosyltransferase involved in cell wall biosynthesis
MKLKIYLHTQSWNVPGAQNSDLKLRKVFISMENYFPNVTIYHPKKFIAGIEFVFKHALRRVSELIFKKNISPFNTEKHHIYYPEFNKFNPDVIVSQGHFPKNNYNVPVIWEIFFIDPVNREVYFSEKDEQIWQEKVKIYGELVKKTSIIGVRDFYSIELIKKMYPESGHKARFLPFFIPNLNPIEKDIIIDKHKNYDKIKILFVGGGAIRKGLIQLVEAFSILFETQKNVELTIISAMVGGEVDLPKGLPIKHFKTLPHEETLKHFSAAHIYAMPSLHESFGLTYIEGMANGCAVMARNKFPQIDMLDHGESGVLIDPLNINQISNELKELCINDSKRIDLALSGWHKFKNKYHWPVAGELWQSAFIEASNTNLK